MRVVALRLWAATAGVLAAVGGCQPQAEETVEIAFERVVCEWRCRASQPMVVPPYLWLELLAGEQTPFPFYFDQMLLESATGDVWVLEEIYDATPGGRLIDPWCEINLTDDYKSWETCSEPLPPWPPDDCYH